MSLRRPSLAWILLTGPTLLLGAALFILLANQARRIDQVRERTAAQQARVIAEDVRVRLSGWQSELENLLRELADDPSPASCWALESTHPLVRGTLIVDANGTVTFPDSAAGSQPEEQQRLLRYQALLSGRVPWQKEQSTEENEPSGWDLGQRSSLQVFKYRQERAYQQKSAAPPSRPVYWHPWQWEDRQYLVATVATPAGGWAALEVEVVALLARMHDVLPPVSQRRGVVELQTAAGLTVHRRSGGGDTESAVELAREPVGSLLPRYQVMVAGPRGSGFAGLGLLLLGGLLALMLPAAIWAGAWLIRRESNRHLEDARKKTSFVSNVSHELKTPLTSIRMYAELLEEGRMTSEEKRRKALRTIGNESRRLSRLVDNVLDFSRLEQNRRQWNPQRIDLGDWFEEHGTDFAWRCSDAGVDFSREMMADCSAVSFDADGLEQIVLNLIDNACKYAADGGHVILEVVETDGAVELRVMDRGPGVPAEQRDKIFEQFHRIDDSLTAAQSGTGLGLSIARRLAERGGGSLAMRPREGGGSVFVLRMPLATEERTES